jgi:hypothetical protein
MPIKEVGANTDSNAHRRLQERSDDNVRKDELLEHIGNAGSHKVKAKNEDYWISTVDLYAGFNQCYLSDEVKPLVAFTVHGLVAEEGRLQFRVLPFGLVSAPTRFNSLVATTLAP